MVDLCLLKYLGSSLPYLNRQTHLADSKSGLVTAKAKEAFTVRYQLVMSLVIRISKSQPCSTSSGGNSTRDHPAIWQNNKMR